MTTLSLFVGNQYDEHTEISLDNIWVESDVVDEDSMHAALVAAIAVWALESGSTFDQVKPMTVDDDAGQELEIGQSTSNPHGWIREVVQLYMWLLCDKHYCPDEAVLAYIDNMGWGWTDFECDLQNVEDFYYTTFDGDYEEYAKEHMNNCGEDLPYWAESYFDYKSYGENLVDAFSRMSWGSKEFLFTQ